MVTITVSGAPGSGTTTISKLLEKKLQIKYVYAGEIFRDMAQKHNMSLEQFGAYCEKNPEIDKQLDDQQKKILKKGNVILEGRISGWLAYRNNIAATKIFLQADLDIRVKRIVNREQGNLDERKKEIVTREQSEKTRYKNYYDIDLNDISVYDLVIDTSDKTPDDILTIIMKNIAS